MGTLRKNRSRKIPKKRYKRRGKITSKKKYKLLFKDIKLFFGLVVVFLIVFSCIFLIFYSLKKVDGYGMLPSLRNRDLTIVKKQTTLKRFDIVYIDNGHKGGFKRIIGLPGEMIEIKEDTLLVNNQPIDEKYLVDKINEYQSKGKNFTENFSLNSLGINEIPEGYYFVLGDNRPYTTDSRDYGLISSDKITGKAVVLLFPIDRSELL